MSDTRSTIKVSRRTGKILPPPTYTPEDPVTCRNCGATMLSKDSTFRSLNMCIARNRTDCRNLHLYPV